MTTPEVDEFNGDDARLLSCAKALLDLDTSGSLVPHGIGGHARGIINALASRLAALRSREHGDGWRELVALRKVAEAARELPRATPLPGGASTLHDFKIPASAVWANDRALIDLDAALAPSSTRGAE